MAWVPQWLPWWREVRSSLIGALRSFPSHQKEPIFFIQSWLTQVFFSCSSSGGIKIGLTGGVGRCRRTGPLRWEQPISLCHLWENFTEPQSLPPFGVLSLNGIICAVFFAITSDNQYVVFITTTDSQGPTGCHRIQFKYQLYLEHSLQFLGIGSKKTPGHTICLFSGHQSPS
jgi:hypothetical protein